MRPKLPRKKRSPAVAEPLPSEADRAPDAIPFWYETARELWVGPHLVKRFSGPAGNQEAVLSNFQEQGWKRQVDDPLSPKKGLNPKKRVHDTVNRLNGNQRVPLLRFRAAGRGTAFMWELRTQL